MKRKIFLLTACLLLATTLLAGCGNGGRDEFYAYLDGKVDNSEVQWEEEGYKTYSWDASEEKKLTTKRGIGIGSTLEEVMKAYPEIKTGSFEVDGGSFVEDFSLEEYIQGNVEEQFSEYTLYFSKYFIKDREASADQYIEYGKSLSEENSIYFAGDPGRYGCKMQYLTFLLNGDDRVKEISLTINERSKEEQELIKEREQKKQAEKATSVG